MKRLIAVTAIVLSALLPGCTERSNDAVSSTSLPNPDTAQKLEFDLHVPDSSDSAAQYRATGYVLYTLSADPAIPSAQREVSLSMNGWVFDERWGSPVGKSVRGKHSETVSVLANMPAVFRVEFPVDQMNGSFFLVVDFTTDGHVLAIQKMFVRDIGAR
jgi:cell division septation protein DedD